MTGRPSHSFAGSLAFLGRWPRRVAAALCLLLAAGSALVSPAPAAKPESGGLRAGEVAVPVSVQSAGHVGRGDRVGVLSRSGVFVADRLRVISVQPPDLDADAVVVVATDRTHALALARYSDTTLVLVQDALP